MKIINKIKHHVSNILTGLIIFLARTLKIDLLDFAHEQNNIGQSCKLETSGEAFFITNFLKKNIQDQKKAILFDVGANVGDYSRMLSSNFPHAEIHCFEPNLCPSSKTPEPSTASISIYFAA